MRAAAASQAPALCAARPPGAGAPQEPAPRANAGPAFVLAARLALASVLMAGRGPVGSSSSPEMSLMTKAISVVVFGVYNAVYTQCITRRAAGAVGACDLQPAAGMLLFRPGVVPLSHILENT